MATINEVAVQAGVSKATVSRYLNGTAVVNKETADKVEAAIKKLNYRPNRIAQSLNTKQSLNIAMVVNDISNPVTATYVKGAEEISSKFNYNFILCNTGFEIGKERKYINSLVEKQIDGIIISPCGVQKDHIVEAMKKKIPFVFITRRILGIDADYVKFDNIDGSYKLIHHLLEIGHRKIGVIGRKIYDEGLKNRCEGYRIAMEEYELQAEMQNCYFGDASREAGYEAMKNFAERDQMPTAVYTSTSMQAIGVIQYCKEHALKIPEDLALASFESFMEFDSIIEPKVTTYDVPFYELGTLAAEILFAKISGKERRIQEVSLAGSIRIEESTIKGG
jgi:DNA-binding LacI/PurR family transcriptional regulator